MLPKAYLISYCRMSGFTWVTISSWLSRSLRPFLYSSVYSCYLFFFKQVKWVYFRNIFYLIQYINIHHNMKSMKIIDLICIFIFIVNPRNSMYILYIKTSQFQLDVFSLCKKFIFNWRIIALQYCIGFHQRSTWISHRYMYVHSLLNLLRTSHPIPPL